MVQSLGYQRPLQATDLWKMDQSRESGNLGAQLDEAWARRVKAANEWNTRLADGEVKPSFYNRTKWAVQAIRGKGDLTPVSAPDRTQKRWKRHTVHRRTA